MNPRRPLQVSATIERELQRRLARGLADPRIRGLVTITKVETTGDLSRTRVFISVMPDEHAELTMHGLRAATNRVRRDIMDRIHIRQMPTLEFVYDEGHREQRIISELLARDRLEREGRAAPVDGSDTDDTTDTANDDTPDTTTGDGTDDRTGARP